MSTKKRNNRRKKATRRTALVQGRALLDRAAPVQVPRSGPGAEMARTGRWPLYECLIDRDWAESRLGNMLIARRHANGTVAVGLFLVDLGAMGVKGAACHWDLDDAKYAEQRTRLAGHRTLVSLGIDDAAAILQTAEGWGAQLGCAPPKEYRLAQLILGDADARRSRLSIPTGREGRAWYCAGPDDNAPLMLAKLRRRAGRDQVSWMFPDWSEQTFPSFGFARGPEPGDREGLAQRMAELKRGLLHTARSKCFEQQRQEYVQGPSGRTSEEWATEDFIAVGRFPEGGDLIDRFLAATEGLQPHEIELVKRYREPRVGVFQAIHVDGGRVLVEEQIDGQRYLVRSNRGADSLEPLGEQPWFMGRLVRFLPVEGEEQSADGHEWLFSGNLTPQPDRAMALHLAAALVRHNHQLTLRSPERRIAAARLHNAEQADFVRHFGADLVSGRAPQVVRRVREWFTAWQHIQQARSDAATALREDIEPLFELAARFETVGIQHHPRWGLLVLPEIELLLASAADPALARVEPESDEDQNDHHEIVLEYLRFADASPAGLELAAQRHPEGFDELLGWLLEVPDFRWAERRDWLLDRFKSDWLARPVPLVYGVVSEAVAARIDGELE